MSASRGAMQFTICGATNFTVKSRRSGLRLQVALGAENKVAPHMSQFPHAR